MKEAESCGTSLAYRGGSLGMSLRREWQGISKIVCAKSWKLCGSDGAPKRQIPPHILLLKTKKNSYNALLSMVLWRF